VTAPAACQTGPSAGVTGAAAQQSWSMSLMRDHPDLARALAVTGRTPRAGHDRKRWETVRWEDYRAHVGVCQSRGPWRIGMVEERDGEPSQWITEAEHLPWQPGWYTALTHSERGLVMSDVPAEIAGMLPFLDRAQADWRQGGSDILISGLGLGIVPAWLLARMPVHRIDVVEIDPDVIQLIARDEAAREVWAADPRLHVHLGDALTWRRPRRPGCELHLSCQPPGTWDAAFHDIWDQPSVRNLPSMRRLHRRYGRLARWQMSWERPECEARRRRGDTGRPGGCRISEDGWPGGDG
jgi:hypothetical protein